MKPILTFLIALIIVTTAFAQQGINYKALIKDNKGNVITNQKITVEFSILQGEAKSSMYTETHSPITDANGTIILNIGKGTSTDSDFSLIKWGNDNHYLQTRIDTGNGLIDMDTTTFNAVPYAFQAQTANMAMNVSGLEAIDEGNGIGWRLIGRDPALYGNVGDNAVDLSNSTIMGTTYGALSDNSTAMGYHTIASGYNSTAIGFGTSASGGTSVAMGASTSASGSYSTAMGLNTTASGSTSTAMGGSTTASGPNSTAMGLASKATGNLSTAFGYLTQASGSVSTSFGNFTIAPSFIEAAFGQYNTSYVPNGSTFWHNADRLFVVGNGTNSSSKSNAITVYKNGNVALGNITPSSSTTENVLDVSGRIRLRPKAGTGSTSGIWYSDVGGINRQFAGAKSHSPLVTNRQWGVYISGWKFWG